MENTKIKMLLLMLEESAIDDLTTKLEMAYSLECEKYCDQLNVHGQDSLPDPVKMKQLWELQQLLKQLGAL